jgi:acyl carrier protein
MDTFEKVQEIIANLFQISPDDVMLETDFKLDLGADELDAVELIMAVEEEFDITIHDEEAANVHTVADLVELISSKI